MDFAALPPEINSARMYAGAGAEPLLSAAAAWDALASELTMAATESRSTVTGLAAVWMGPSASAMAAAATTYTSWLTSTAAMALSTATQAQAAVSAYEAAFSATVPPVSIITNRLQLATLVATNFLGINTAAIMATEAQYTEFWAQDVAAMTAYSAESAAATSALPQFTQPPQVTKPTGLATQAATAPASTQTILNWLLGQLNTYGQAFVSSGPLELPLSLLGLFTVLWAVSSPGSALGQAITNRISAGGSFVLPEFTMPASAPVPTSTSAAVRAGMADGERLGGLRVPPGWARESTRGVPPERPIGVPITPGESPGLAGLAGAGGLAGLAGLRSGTASNTTNTPKYGTRPTVMPKHPFGG